MQLLLTVCTTHFLHILLYLLICAHAVTNLTYHDRNNLLLVLENHWFGVNAITTKPAFSSNYAIFFIRLSQSSKFIMDFFSHFIEENDRDDNFDSAFYQLDWFFFYSFFRWNRFLSISLALSACQWYVVLSPGDMSQQL